MTRVPLRQLVVSREFPPAPYPAGGIGTYVGQITRLLAGAGETVHVIAERWSGAPRARESRLGGRLVIHRLRPDEPARGTPGRQAAPRELRALGASPFPVQRFAWQAALLAEDLVEREGIDLIEAQEWEAPLYYFLLRRGLGLGPARTPPCLIHLHSPTEFIHAHNEGKGSPGQLDGMRLEEYCIRTADGLLSPSRFLAAQVAARYGVPEAGPDIIPYPVGDFPFVTRAAEVWTGARFVFVGRLEPRKGLVEFIEAAVSVAASHGSACFDFIGEDLWYRDEFSMRRYLESRIPAALRPRFRFLGGQPRERLPALLSAARAAVVPSRWENLPNVCLEAMSSGLPVLASPHGGMDEVIDDGVSGWIAADQTPDGLAAALRRALETPAARCDAMGRAAAEAVRRRCADPVVLDRHLTVRDELVRRGADRSLRIPRIESGATAKPLRPAGGRAGIVVVLDATTPAAAKSAQDALATLSPPPLAHCAVTGNRNEPNHARALNEAAERLLREHPDGGGVALIPAEARLRPDVLGVATAVLERQADIGAVSAWADGANGFVRPPPGFPYQWLADDLAETSVYRREAFLEAGGLADGFPLREARWALGVALLAGGWQVVSYPAILATRAAPGRDSAERNGAAGAARSAALAAMRERFPREFLRDMARVAAIQTAGAAERGLRLRDALNLPVRAKVSLVLEAVRRPRRALGWLQARWERLRR